MKMRTAAAVSIGAILIGLLIALWPYRPTDPGSGLVLHCGRPALAWRGQYGGTGSTTLPIGGPAVEREPVCAVGVARRLTFALLVTVVGQVPLLVVAARRTD